MNNNAVNTFYLKVIGSLSQVGNMGRKQAGVMCRKVGGKKIVDYLADEINTEDVTPDSIADMIFYMYHNKYTYKDYLKEAKETEIEYRKRNKYRYGETENGNEG